MFGQRSKVGQWQLPFRPRPVLRTLRQNLRREHAVDLEKLEFDSVAAGIGRSVNKSLGAGQIAAVIAGGLGDEQRTGMVSFHLTISKERMAKKRLTGDLPHESRSRAPDHPRWHSF